MALFSMETKFPIEQKKNLTSEILLLHIHGIFCCILDALFYSSEEGLDRTNLCIEYIIPD